MKAFSQAPALVQIVAALLLMEALIIAWVFFALLLELLAGNVINIYAEIFLLVTALGATAWVVNFTRGILQKKRWARSAAFFWQLLQAVIGAGAIVEEGISRVAGIGIVGVAFVVVVLLFNKIVVAATNQ